MGTITYEDVSVTYASNGQQAIQEFNLTIQSGEIVSFVGPSGCGKSTALNVAAGLVQPTTGTLKIDDQVVEGPGLDRGVVFQNYSLFPWMSNVENVRFALAQKEKKPRHELAEIAQDILQKVGIEGKAHRAYPSQISGGMQQRVALARMFALDSPIFLMDEPFAAVDEITRKKLQDLLLDLWEIAEHKKTILMVTHNIEEAIYLSDRVVVLHDGQIITTTSVPFLRPRDREGIESEAEYTSLRKHLLRAIDGYVQEELK